MAGVVQGGPFVWVVGVVAGVASAIVAAQLADRSAPIEQVSSVVETPILAPGEAFHGQWVINVLRPCKAAYFRWLQSSTNPRYFEPLPPLDLDLAQLVSTSPQLLPYPVTPFDIPLDAPEGEMAYHVVAQFSCPWHWPGHWIAPLVVTYSPMTFKVAPEPPPGDRE